MEIARQEVEANVADLGDFSCQCYASGHLDSQAVRSETAKIRVACEFSLFFDANFIINFFDITAHFMVVVYRILLA